ncbi:MAG: hypothetical protein JWO94_605 [Verrucomicrobiaceae bacterium]|nr:hypothetical protein [Verrucomicrobiaceae bacterium]
MENTPPTANLQVLLAQLNGAAANSSIIGSAFGSPASASVTEANADKGRSVSPTAPDNAVA